MALRIQSVSEPFESLDPDVLREAIDAIALADAMGLLTETVERLDLPTVRRLAKAVGGAGIAAVPLALLGGGPPFDEARFRRAIRALREALEDSPTPGSEWPALLELFGVEQLARLISVSSASLRRYAAGRRPTPDQVAARLHFLAKVVGDLRGAYNDVGVRRWFERKRSALGNRSPAGILRRSWSPEDPGAQQVRALARSLVFSPAT